ncbi:MAG: ribonuclease P protein subunit [Thermoplasmata archaeon]
MNPFLTDIIGENIEIIESSDRNIIGYKGKVINETKNIIKVRGIRDIIVQKTGTSIIVGNQIVRMDSIKFRPEEKIKKIRRRGKL